MTEGSAAHCSVCQEGNPANAKFCCECGAMLRAPGAGDASAPTQPPSQAERRFLSLLFCDLVGSTTIASQLDPEDLSQVLQAYQSAVAATANRMGGFIARFTGDGVLVYFGWPRATESDAERAVHAALSIVEAVGRISADGQRLQVRVGIATGLVVVGELLGSGIVHEHAAVGAAPNLAARLQALAEPGGILVDQSTKTRIGDLFECEALGPRPIKGLAEPVPAWRVVGTSAIQSRFEALRTSRLSPFVGRESELETLHRHWVEMKNAGGHLVLITGEPGIGKSRLMGAFQERLQGQSYACLRFFCAPHHQDDALYPAIANIEHAARFQRTDTPREKARKLQAYADATGAPAEDIALFSQLLSLPLKGLSGPDLTPQRRKERTFEALFMQMQRLAHKQPLLVIIEDVHWSDPTSRELFEYAIDRLHQLPVLMIMTFRSDWRSPWLDRPDVSLLTVGRLSRPSATEMIKDLIVGDALRAELIEIIAAETDGVPLFIEELTKAILEGVVQREAGHSATVAPVIVPATLHASLMARLDRLTAGKEVAQIGSVIGRGFSHSVLADVARLPQPVLSRGIEELVAAELLYRRGMAPDAEYAFKHALVQDVAYQSLVRLKRSDLHSRVVDVLIKTVPDVEETEPGLLAHHAMQAGQIEQAASYYRRAGERSAERAALAETRSYLERGLAVARSLAMSAGRRALEVELKLALGRVLLSMKGSADAEGGQAFAEAVEMCRRLDHPELMTRALWGFWFNKAHRQQPAGDEPSAHELLGLGSAKGYIPAQIVGRAMLGIIRLWQGRIGEARTNLAESLSLSRDAAYVAPDLAIVSEHIDVHVRMQLSLTLACLGHFEHAAVESTLGVRNIMAAAHLPLRAIVLGNKCRHDWFVRDRTRLAESAGALVSLSEEQGFPFYLAVGRCHLGWLAATGGRFEEGIGLLRDGLTALRSAQATIWEPYFLGMTGDALICGGNSDEAGKMLDRALAVSAETGGVWFDAELHRLAGQVALLRPAPDYPAAEGACQRAIEIARSQSARLWELRATTDLARLWSSLGRADEARRALSGVHGWFATGYDTSDLKDAALLLAGLAENTAVE